MNDLIKKSMACFLTLVMSLTILSPNLVCADYGDENIGYHKKHNSAYGVDVSVKDGVDISEAAISSILASVRESDRKSLSIVSVKKLRPEKNDLNFRGTSNNADLVTPMGNSYYYTKTITNDQYLTDEKFLISVATGMTSTLSSSVTISASAKVSGSVEASYLNFIKAKISAEYGSAFSETVSKTYKFVGPPEDSNFNSRTYYVGILNDVGYYKVWKWRNNKKRVNFVIPREMVIYKVDRNISK